MGEFNRKIGLWSKNEEGKNADGNCSGKEKAGVLYGKVGFEQEIDENGGKKRKKKSRKGVGRGDLDEEREKKENVMRKFKQHKPVEHIF